jgi:hypothetical protein
MGVSKADLADLFFTEFEKRFTGIDAVCDGIGPPGPWTITDVENPHFRLRFAFEEESNVPGPTLVIKEIVVGPGKAPLLRGMVGFAVDFVEHHGLYNLAIGTTAEDEAGRQRFVNALCAITPKLHPDLPSGCVRTRVH